MVLLEGILYGLCLYFCFESSQRCYEMRRRYRNSEELIPMMIANSSQQHKVDIEKIAPLCDEDLTDNCSICFESFAIIRYKRKTICGHVFCSECIHEWFHKKRTCPLCNKDLDL